MTKKSRLDKLFGGLSARERGVLALRSMKEGTDDDPQIKHSMPDSQVCAYNRLVALMNGVNSDLGPYVLLIKALVDQASIRVGWLVTVNLLSIRHKKSEALADDLTEALIERLQDGIKRQWQEIRAVETLTAEVADEFRVKY